MFTEKGKRKFAGMTQIVTKLVVDLDTQKDTN